MNSPRVIMYAQTFTTQSKEPIPLLPLIHNPSGITHLIIAMLHLNVNHPHGYKITINDNQPDDPIWDTLRHEIKQFQAAGIRVLCCLGGAAQGSYRPALEDHWDVYYPLLQHFIIDYGLDGLDIDIEECVDQSTVERLINTLRHDFGPNFLLTLTPVANALQPGGGQPGGANVDYQSLESKFGASISWYNTQFYCGWGDISTTTDYDRIIANGFPANKVVVLLSTNPKNAPPAYTQPKLSEYMMAIRVKHPNLGGVAGWEYFNAEVTGSPTNPPWEWLQAVKNAVNRQKTGRH